MAATEIRNANLTGPRLVPARRILVADDDRMIRLLVRMLLEQDGFKVLEAENGAEALAMTRSAKPDLLLVDLQMPDMTGYQVLQKMLADPAQASIPVIVLTSESGSAVESQVLDMGAEDFLAKPFKPEVLIARIRGAFRRSAAVAA
jgi:DNA-binding response OmpR family regulator